LKQSVELEPLSAHYQFCLGLVLNNARQYDEAIPEFKKALELDSTFRPTYAHLSMAYSQKGLYDNAIDAVHRYVQLNPDSRAFEQYLLGRIYASMGRKDDVRKCIRQLHQLAESAPVDPGDIASLYARLGEKDSAFVYLDKAYRDHTNQIYFLKVDPDLDSLRSDIRYMELLRKMGFSE
jgi:tetratricopeptide (TPR) repeat protein